MLWKILSCLAAIALMGGVWFSYKTQKSMKAEKELTKRAKENLASLKETITKGNDAKIRREKELADMEKQVGEAKGEVVKVQADADQKGQEVDILKKQLEEVNKQLIALEGEISKVGNVKKLLAQVDELNAQKQAAQAAVVNMQQKLALSDGRVAKIEEEITRLEDVDRRQRTGVVDPSFSARVSQQYTDFGFVILNKGNLGGMFANAMLDVKRGSNVVARLKVRDVEQSMSVADLVPGTLASGDSVRAGDLVVASRVAPPPPVTPAAAAPAPADAGAPGAAPMTPAADPFAGGAAGMTAPAPAPAADPFAPAAGGMAPAPAPAPAPGADPFAPAPPAGAAPAPAPAAGAAPAPAPGADPFAPQPAPGMAPQ